MNKREELLARLKGLNNQKGPIDLNESAMDVVAEVTGARRESLLGPESNLKTGERKTYLHLLLDHMGSFSTPGGKEHLGEHVEAAGLWTKGEAVPDEPIKRFFRHFVETAEVELEDILSDPEQGEVLLGLAQFVLLLVEDGILDQDASDRAVEAARSIVGKRGAEARHEPIRAKKAAFQIEYRELRDQNPDRSRRWVVDQIYEGYFEVTLQTAEKWAKEADNEDGLTRKPGRTKNHPEA